MTIEEITKLRPSYTNSHGFHLYDWFEIIQGINFTYIRSGLRHMDGYKFSPYWYDKVIEGDSHERYALQEFNEWYNNILIFT